MHHPQHAVRYGVCEGGDLRAGSYSIIKFKDEDDILNSENESSSGTVWVNLYELAVSKVCRMEGS